jgi:hypothetical protein
MGWRGVTQGEIMLQRYDQALPQRQRPSTVAHSGYTEGAYRSVFSTSESSCSAGVPPYDVGVRGTDCRDHMGGVPKY